MSFAILAARRRVACLMCSVRTPLRAYATIPDTPEPPAKAATKASAPPPNGKRDPSLYSVRIDAPRSHGAKVPEFKPKVLPRPIGMLEPPRAGENSGIDTRSSAQKRADMLDYDKHLLRRQELIKEFQRPYFRDFRNLRYQGGKSFIAPSRLFKAEHALYFPNIYGETLEKKARGADAQEPNRDTTPVLRGRTSIVTVFSSTWAESQTESFIAEKANPELHKVLREFAHAEPRPKGQLQSALAPAGAPLPGLPVPQVVRLNVETSKVRAWIVRCFFWSLRRYFAKPDWGKYFLVSQGLTDEIRESTGILNGAVGYIYLVDEHCRIRWAGSGDASEEERQSLAKGLRRLLEQHDNSN